MPKNRRPKTTLVPHKGPITQCFSLAMISSDVRDLSGLVADLLFRNFCVHEIFVGLCVYSKRRAGGA
jgi:hypothetical protein